MVDVYGRLAQVQASLHAPKGQTNSFGGYKYRSAEDILEAVKPLLFEHGLVLHTTDDVVPVGERVYVRATATVTVCESNGESRDALSLSAQGWAREALNKKGADEAQVTGMASSYARKYAYNALFAIDDTKDADTDEARRQSDSAPADDLTVLMNQVKRAAQAKGLTGEQIKAEYLRPLGWDCMPSQVTDVEVLRKVRDRING